jgi:hypothetical protein
LAADDPDLTSDKSTEAYRNWWPGPDDAMVRLMNRSIDLLEDMAATSDNRFLMNRRGYVYATADPERAEAMQTSAVLASSYGAGPLRIHAGGVGGPGYLPAPADGWEGQPDGADLILDQDLLRETFPYLSPDTVAALHARRCGGSPVSSSACSSSKKLGRQGSRSSRGASSGSRPQVVGCR